MSDVNSEILGKAFPQKESKNSYVKEIGEAQKELCKGLLAADFNFDSWFMQFNAYIEKYERFFYSVISRFIFAESDDKKVASILENLNYTFSRIRKTEDSVSNTAAEEIGISEKQYKLLLKFIDHCNLASIQRDTYRATKESLKNEVANLFDTKYAAEYDTKIKPKLDSHEKNITAQLIGLVSIFTALSFVIFGSISILDNLLVNIRTLPILKVVFIGDLWMLCMVNIFTLFARMISKFISQDWQLTRPLIISNVLLCVVLAVLAAVYAYTVGGIL